MKIPYKKFYNDFKDYMFGYDFYKPVEHNSNKGLPLYYLNFGWTLEKEHFDHFDENGVPMRKYLNFNIQYNPTRIAAYALLYWNKYILTESEEYKEIFLKQVHWFENSAKEVHNNLTWTYEFDYGPLKAPWISAMAHGEAISVLTRAFLLTGDEKYKNIILNAINIYDITVDQGSMQSTFPDGSICFEEYPIPNPQHIFNGNNYAIFGLYDYCKYINPEDHQKQELLNKAINALKQNLKNYDNKFWSLYHFPVEKISNPTTAYYHDLHIGQLEALFYLTNDPIFQEYAYKWRKYKSNLLNRLYSMIKKLHYRYYYPVSY